MGTRGLLRWAGVDAASCRGRHGRTLYELWQRPSDATELPTALSIVGNSLASNGLAGWGRFVTFCASHSLAALLAFWQHHFIESRIFISEKHRLQRIDPSVFGCSGCATHRKGLQRQQKIRALFRWRAAATALKMHAEPPGPGSGPRRSSPRSVRPLFVRPLQFPGLFAPRLTVTHSAATALFHFRFCYAHAPRPWPPRSAVTFALPHPKDNYRCGVSSTPRLSLCPSLHFEYLSLGPLTYWLP